MDAAQGFGGHTRQKVPHGLGGGPEVPAAQLEGGLLPPGLEGHARQRVLAAVVGGGDPHQEAAVDKGAVPGAAAHAVGHQPSRLRRGGHHRAAGTHAEGEGAAAVGEVAGELVVRRGQLLPGGAELGRRHRRLAVLNAHADGKGLGGHGHPGVHQHLKGVPGGVAGGEHQGVAGQVIPPGGAVHRQGGHPAVLQPQAGESVAEADVAPQADQLQTDGFHHVPQHVGADVGLVLV